MVASPWWLMSVKFLYIVYMTFIFGRKAANTIIWLDKLMLVR